MKPSRGRKPLFDRLRDGLEEGIRHAKGEITLRTTTVELPDRPPAIDAKELTSLRQKSGMSQAVFARLLNVSPKTVQSWEQGQRRPSQAALRLIQVYRHDPACLLEMVGMSRLAERRRTPVSREADLF
jgi:putative transcriptional regulator